MARQLESSVTISDLADGERGAGQFSARISGESWNGPAASGAVPNNAPVPSDVVTLLGDFRVNDQEAVIIPDDFRTAQAQMAQHSWMAYSGAALDDSVVAADGSAWSSIEGIRLWNADLSDADRTGLDGTGDDEVILFIDENNWACFQVTAGAVDGLHYKVSLDHTGMIGDADAVSCDHNGVFYRRRVHIFFPHRVSPPYFTQWSESRVWDGTQWLKAHRVISGNLLVLGTIAGEAIVVDRAVINSSIQIGGGLIKPQHLDPALLAEIEEETRFPDLTEEQAYNIVKNVLVGGQGITLQESAATSRLTIVGDSSSAGTPQPQPTNQDVAGSGGGSHLWTEGMGEIPGTLSSRNSGSLPSAGISAKRGRYSGSAETIKLEFTATIELGREAVAAVPGERYCAQQDKNGACTRWETRPGTPEVEELAGSISLEARFLEGSTVIYNPSSYTSFTGSRGQIRTFAWAYNVPVSRAAVGANKTYKFQVFVNSSSNVRVTGQFRVRRMR